VAGPAFASDRRHLGVERNRVLVKKTELAAYGHPRAKGVIAIKLDPEDDVIGVGITTGNDEIILGTRDGMAIRFTEDQARSMGRASRGVKGIKLRTGDAVVDMIIAEPGTALLTVCENGFGKRTDLEDYRAQSRAGLGLLNIKTTERNGKVVALKATHDDDELMLITANGIIIRTGLEQVRAIGRNTQGVKIMRLDSGDKIVAVERIAKNNNDTEQTEKTDDK